MRNIISGCTLFFILFSFLFHNSHASSVTNENVKKLLIKDEAVFKIKGRIFFLSDLVPIIKEIRFFRCLSPKSLVLQGVGLNKGVLLTMPEIKSVQSLNKKEEDFLGKLIRVIKTSIYIKERQKDLNKSHFKRGFIERCQKKVYGRLKKSENRNDLMLTESFLRERFNPKSQVTDRSQYEVFKKKNKFLNEKALKEAFMRNKNLQIVEAIKLFVTSLDKRISHETYF